MIIMEPDLHDEHVSLLILGAGWTSTFLIPLLEQEGIEYVATTTDGRNGTVPFKFEPGASREDQLPQFKKLPYARTVLIVFPLIGKGQAPNLVDLYLASHPMHEQSVSVTGDDGKPKCRFIQFGVTSIWTEQTWHDESSPYDTSNTRAVAEDDLLGIDSVSASVLSLAGLYGAKRQPRDWVDRVIKTKEDLRRKGALHVIHGEDVARAVVALHRDFTPGKRWIICDMHVYDWWDLTQDWALQRLRELRDIVGPQPAAGDENTKEFVKGEAMLAWVGELMVEEGVKALPRDTASVGRRLDGRAFWSKMGIWPTQGRIR